MPSSAIERFTEAARARGLDLSPVRYPDGTRTAADAAAAIGCEVAQIVKSLVVVLDDDRPALALVSGANRLDLAALAAAAGAGTARMADADEARDATGFAVGGVPPFGHPAPLPTWVDPDLVGFDVVHAAAGTPDTCVPLTPAELLAATGGTVSAIAAGA